MYSGGCPDTYEIALHSTCTLHCTAWCPPPYSAPSTVLHDSPPTVLQASPPMYWAPSTVLGTLCRTAKTLPGVITYSKSPHTRTYQHKSLEAVFPKLCTLQLRTCFSLMKHRFESQGLLSWSLIAVIKVTMVPIGFDSFILLPDYLLGQKERF